MVDHKKRLTDYSKYTVPGYPVRHKKKDPFNPRLNLGLEYRDLVRRIRAMDSELGDMLLSDKDYLVLVSDAYASNIHWSTRLEGNELSLKEVERLSYLFSSGASAESDGGPVQEILNHLYSYFIKSLFEIPWSIDTVLETQKLLLRETGVRFRLGELRKDRLSVIGNGGIEYFVACPPEHIEGELSSLLEWIGRSPFDEITTATIFFHEFESIHPFQDGNGRTGRTLFQILLQELGLTNSKFCKFEQELLEPPETYYTLLAYTDLTGDYSPLVMYVAESLYFAYSEAIVTFGNRDLMKDLDALSAKIMKKAKESPSFTLVEAGSWVREVSEQTVRIRLNELVDLGLLEKIGRTKALTFRFRDPFRYLKDSIDRDEGR